MNRATCIAAMGTAMAVTGCQVVFGIERIDLAEESVETPCVVADDWVSAIRIGNFHAGSETIDICFRREHALSFSKKGIVEQTGTGCPKIGYKQLTVPLGIEPGTYELKAIEDGGNCADEGLASATTTLTEDQVMTVALLGGAEGSHELHAYPDARPITEANQLRFIHGLVGYDQLDVSRVVPIETSELLFENAEFGLPAESSPAPLLEVRDGYLQYYPIGITARIGVAAAGSDEAIATLPVDLAGNHTHTLVALGVRDSAEYPPELWACSESRVEPHPAEALFASCGDPRDLTIEVFDTNLSDLFSSFIAERRQPVIDAVTTMDADLVCLTGLYDPADAAAVVAGASEAFVTAVSSDDLRIEGRYSESLLDRDGNVPSYDPPACAHVEDRFEPLLSCFVEGSDVGSGCTERIDGESYMRYSGDALDQCWADICQSPISAFALNPTEEVRSCWSCAVAGFGSGLSVEETRRRCSEGTTREDRMAYDGTLGLVVLSRYPIVESEARLLPSSVWAHGVVRTRVELGNGELIDFYCTSTGVAENEPAVPYSGPYGGGQEDQAGALMEQRLVVERVLEFVDEQTVVPNLRPIVAGSIYSGPAYDDGRGDTLVDSWLPEVYEVLASRFDPLVAPGYPPACNSCVANPAGLGYRSDVLTGAWISHLFGQGIRPIDVFETSLTHETPTIEVNDPDDSNEVLLIPLSQQYGVRSVVRVDQ